MSHMTEDQREVSQRAREILGSLRERRELFESQVKTEIARNKPLRDRDAAKPPRIGSGSISIGDSSQGTDDAVVPSSSSSAVVKPLAMRPSRLSPEDTQNITSQLDSSIQERRGRLSRLSGRTVNSLEAKLDEVIGRKTGSSAGFSSPSSEHSSAHTIETGELTASPSSPAEDGWDEGGRFLDSSAAIRTIPCPPLQHNPTDEKTDVAILPKDQSCAKKKKRETKKTTSLREDECRLSNSREISEGRASEGSKPPKTPPLCPTLRKNKSKRAEKTAPVNNVSEDLSGAKEKDNKSDSSVQSVDGWCEERVLLNSRDVLCDKRGLEDSPSVRTLQFSPLQTSPSLEGRALLDSERDQSNTKATSDKTKNAALDSWCEEHLLLTSRDTACNDNGHLLDSPSTTTLPLDAPETNSNSDMKKRPTLQSSLSEEDLRAKLDHIFASERGETESSSVDTELVAALSRHQQQRRLQEELVQASIFRQRSLQAGQAPRSLFDETSKPKKSLAPALLTKEDLELPGQLKNQGSVGSDKQTKKTQQSLSPVPKSQASDGAVCEPSTCSTSSPLSTEKGRAVYIDKLYRASEDDPRVQWSKSQREIPSPRRERRELHKVMAQQRAEKRSSSSSSNNNSNFSSSSRSLGLHHIVEEKKGDDDDDDDENDQQEVEPVLGDSRFALSNNAEPRKKPNSIGTKASADGNEEADKGLQRIRLSPRKMASADEIDSVVISDASSFDCSTNDDSDSSGWFSSSEEDLLAPSDEEGTTDLDTMVSRTIAREKTRSLSPPKRRTTELTSRRKTRQKSPPPKRQTADPTAPPQQVPRGRSPPRHTRQTSEPTKSPQTVPRQRSPPPQKRQTSEPAEWSQAVPRRQSPPPHKRQTSEPVMLPQTVPRWQSSDRTRSPQTVARRQSPLLPPQRQRSDPSKSPQTVPRRPSPPPHKRQTSDPTMSSETVPKRPSPPPHKRQTSDPTMSSETVPRRPLPPPSHKRQTSDRTRSPQTVPRGRLPALSSQRNTSKPTKSPQTLSLPHQKSQTSEPTKSPQTVPRRQSPTLPPQKQTSTGPMVQQRVNYIGRRRHVQVFVQQSVLSDLDEEEEYEEERKEEERRRRKERETAAAVAKQSQAQYVARSSRPTVKQPPLSARKRAALSRPAYLLVAEETANKLCSTKGGLYTLALASGLTKNSPIPVQGQGVLAKTTRRQNTKGFLCLSTDFRCGAFGSLYDLAVRSGCKVDEPLERKLGAPSGSVAAAKERKKAPSPPPPTPPYIPCQGGHYFVALKSGLTRKALRSKRGYTISTTMFRDAARRQKGKALMIPEEVSDRRCGTTGTLYMATKTGIELVPVEGSLKAIADRTGLRF